MVIIYSENEYLQLYLLGLVIYASMHATVPRFALEHTTDSCPLIGPTTHTHTTYTVAGGEASWHCGGTSAAVSASVPGRHFNVFTRKSAE